MIECVLAWTFLIIGAVTRDPLYFVAAGAFAIAAQIEDFANKK